MLGMEISMLHFQYFIFNVSRQYRRRKYSRSKI